MFNLRCEGDNQNDSYVVTLNIYSLNIFSRQFQFRLVHNYLYVNNILYKWKVVDSWRCSFCFINKESIEHLFCECHISVTLYMQIKQWCQEMHINFPDMNLSNIIYGIIPCSGDNILINHFILFPLVK